MIGYDSQKELSDQSGASTWHLIATLKLQALGLHYLFGV